jgi:hypothetical protein
MEYLLLVFFFLCVFVIFDLTAPYHSGHESPGGLGGTRHHSDPSQSTIVIAYRRAKYNHPYDLRSPKLDLVKKRYEDGLKNPQDYEVPDLPSWKDAKVEDIPFLSEEEKKMLADVRKKRDMR